MTDESAGPQAPDPHGAAALLLVESLLHSLIAKSVLSVQDVVDTADTAAQVAAEIADESDRPEARRSLSLIDAIAASLRHDVPANGETIANDWLPE